MKMNNITQMAFFEHKSPITIRRKLEKKIKSRPIAPRRKNYIQHNISSKALDIPDIFSHSIEKKHKINISYNKISQKLKSKSQEKSFNDNTNIINKKDIINFPMNNDFSFFDVKYFPNKRNSNNNLMNSKTVNNNNSNIINNIRQIQNSNLIINKSMYKHSNISTSLPKIKIKKNPLPSILNNKEIEKDKTFLDKTTITKEKRSISQRSINHNIQNISNMKSKIVNKFSENNNININKNNNNCSQKSLNELLCEFYPLYQQARHSENPFDNIYSYGVNTYKGIIRQYNEDRVTILINANINKNKTKNADIKNNCKVSYFSIYDGHAGNKCCEYLKMHLHQYIFDSEFFPQNPIKAVEEGFKICENNFMNSLYSQNQCIETSGSCAIIILIINDSCYIINLGDSRALYSFDDGKKFFQLSRDHKPNDPIEKKRIYKAGGNIYRTNGQQIQDNSIGLNAKGALVNLPYRIFPGRLSVSYFLIL